MKNTLAAFFWFTTVLIASTVSAQTLAPSDSIGIDFASPGAVQGTNNAVDPAADTNFNAFDLQTAGGATASFNGTLINLAGGSTTVGFSVTNNMGKASGLTAVPGQADQHHLMIIRSGLTIMEPPTLPMPAALTLASWPTLQI